MATISRDDKLARDAKVLRAAAKAARAIVRRSAHMGRSAQVLASVRAWRRHGTTDIMADYELSLVVGDDERMRRLYARRGADDGGAGRGAPPRVVPAERAQRRGRPQGGRPRRGAHDQLIGPVRLTAHDYTDVRSACSEAIEWCWFYYAWALAAARAGAAGDLGRAGALFVQVRGPRPAAKRSSDCSPPWPSPGAGARCARRRRPGPRRARVPRRLPQGAGRPGPDRRRPEGRRAARFDGLWLWYALRYSIRPSNAEALVASRGAARRTRRCTGATACRGRGPGHALAARDQDDGDDETWQYVAQGATDPQDAPTQRRAWPSRCASPTAPRGAARTRRRWLS